MILTERAGKRDKHPTQTQAQAQARAQTRDRTAVEMGEGMRTSTGVGQAGEEVVRNESESVRRDEELMNRERNRVKDLKEAIRLYEGGLGICFVCMRAMYAYVCMRAMFTCSVYICKSVCMYVYMYTYTYIQIYACMYIRLRLLNMNWCIDKSIESSCI
jgi:hypothetical protein